ncbi:MAG: DUF177 domain-containing protein [Bacteroidaceae bacterium]|nr:DUF177 domain-containing protein [Bacteroidaceae bacterium]
MGKLDVYNVELKGLKEKQASYRWTVGQDFFEAVQGEDVRKGNVDVELTVSRQSSLYHLAFVLNGTVTVTCDRCLDDMSLDIETNGEMKVRLGDDFADEGDVVVVPEKDGSINVAWYIYEYIALAIPIKHVHAPGKCNKGMMEKLDGHLVGDDNDEPVDSETVDPRWEGLNNIMDSDND